MSQKLSLSTEKIISKIYLIREEKVMLDSDLAELYGVSTGNLNKAVGRNIKRFPEDFMFQLTEKEWENLKSQNEASSWGGTRKAPKAFTEQGLAMLSGVLSSERAIMVNIQIMRTYTKMREMLLTHKDLLLKMEQIEKNLSENNKEIQVIFQYLNQLESAKKQGLEQKNRKPIGYKRKDEE